MMGCQPSCPCSRMSPGAAAARGSGPIVAVLKRVSGGPSTARRSVEQRGVGRTELHPVVVVRVFTRRGSPNCRAAWLKEFASGSGVRQVVQVELATAEFGGCRSGH